MSLDPEIRLLMEEHRDLVQERLRITKRLQEIENLLRERQTVKTRWCQIEVATA